MENETVAVVWTEKNTKKRVKVERTAENLAEPPTPEEAGIKESWLEWEDEIEIMGSALSKEEREQNELS